MLIVSFCVLFMIGCIASVSAGWFDGKKETVIRVEQVSTSGNIEDATPRTLVLYLSSEDGAIDGRDVEVHVNEQLDYSTAKDGYVQGGGSSGNYTVTTSSTNHGKGTVEVCTLQPGKQYSISAEFKGDEEYEACNLTDYSISTMTY